MSWLSSLLGPPEVWKQCQGGCPHSKPRVPGSEELPTLPGMGTNQPCCSAVCLLPPPRTLRWQERDKAGFGGSWVAPGGEDRGSSEVWRAERDSLVLMTAGSTPTTVEATATPSLLNYLEL